MHDQPDVRTKRNGSLLGAGSLSIVHLLAFGMLYLILVQLNFSFQDFYKTVGVKLTPEFHRIALMSNYIAAYTPLVLLIIALDVFVVFRLARSRSRWTSVYSHAVLLSMGFTGFLWTARSIEPMAWGASRVDNAPVVSVLEPVIDQHPSSDQ